MKNNLRISQKFSCPWFFIQQNPQQNEINFILSQRQKLERYFEVLGSTSRQYLIDRIRVLAKGSYLTSFNWNGGGMWNKKPWTTEFLTDSQIVLHLFCTFMDNAMPDQQTFNGKPFTNRHLVITPGTPDSTKTSVIIYQRHIHPPHFEIVSSQPNETWEVFQGRNNLFHSLMLFIYCVQKKFSSHLDQISLANPRIRLLSVIE